MTDAIEPISPTNKKKKINPFLVVPPPPAPIKWDGVSLVNEFSKIIFNSASRVIEATLENFQWEKKEKEKRTKEDRQVKKIRLFQKGLENKNFNRKLVVAKIQGA